MRSSGSSLILYVVAAVSLILLLHPAGPASRGFGEENNAALRQNEGKVKILLLATPPDHPYGTHMYQRGCELMAKCLRQHSGIEAVVCVGWPSDPKMLEGVRAIALYSGPGDFVLRGPHREQFEALMRQGVGFSAMHWSTGAMPDTAQLYKSYLGGYFMGKFGLNTTATTVQRVAEDHPVCRGWSDFGLTDEIYLNPELLPATRAVAKVNVPNRGETTPKDHIVGWVYERPESGGGRSFGCSLGHFHKLFGLEGLRRLMVNGILWTAGAEVPTGGAACEIDSSDLELPPDPSLAARAKQIAAQVKQFDKNGDGDLDETELSSLVNDMIEEQKQTPLYLQVFDKDKDGTLSAEETKQAYPLVRNHFLQQCRAAKVPISAASSEK